MRLFAAELAEASTGELVDAVAVLAAELAARPVPESPVVCMELAETLARSIDVGEAALAGLVGRVDRSGEVARWGFACTSAWLRHRLGMRTGRARERLVLARQLPRLRRTGKGLAVGEVSYGYAAAITGALSRLGDDDATAGERILLDLAGEGASVNQVAKAGDRIGEVIAESEGRDLPPEECRRGFKQSWIQRSRSLDGGTWVKGWLSPEHAAAWDHILAPLTRPAGAADERDHAERTADALHTLLTQGHRRTAMTLVIETGTLNGDRPARLPGGGLISPERARQIALNAGVSALITTRDGRPLYLGHTTRLATPHQRRVIETLYETCAADNCDIPVHLCEIHHAGGGWKHGVPTDIDRLAPLCSFHNQWVERYPNRVVEERDRRHRLILRLEPPRRSASGRSRGDDGGTRSRGP